MAFATLRPGKDGTTQEIEPATWVKVCLALIAIMPTFLTAWAAVSMLTPSQKETIALEHSKHDLEKRKFDFERRKADAELYKSALAAAEEGERKKRVEFLTKAKLVDNNEAVGALDSLPGWQ